MDNSLLISDEKIYKAYDLVFYTMIEYSFKCICEWRFSEAN